MKILIILFLTINLFAQNNLDFDSKFGFLYTGTLLSNFKDARKSLSKWLSDIAVENNGKVEVLYYDNSDELYSAFKNKKLDMVVLDMHYFFENQKDIKKRSNNYWTLISDDTKFTQFYLIANKSVNAKSFKDIKNRTLSIKDENRVASIWLDKNSLKYNKSSSKNALKTIKYTKKESTTILNVFFKKSDFAVVSKKTWNTMIELNPAIKKKVQIISKSKQIHIPFIGIFDKSGNQKAVNAFFSLSKDFKTLSGGEHIISLLKFDSILRIDKKALKNLEEYYLEYFILRNKYK